MSFQITKLRIKAELTKILTAKFAEKNVLLVHFLKYLAKTFKL